MLSRAVVRFMVSCGLLALAACSGGGDDGTTGTGVAEKLTGTAAAGAPIVNATVTVKDSAGAKKTTTTGADGKYEIDVSGMTGPYLVKVNVDASRSLYAVATKSGVTNIHPLSDVACRNWFGTHGRDVDQEIDNAQAIKDPPKENELTAIKDAIHALLRIAYAQFGVDAAFDFDRTAFDADGNGFDRLLDNLSITIEKNKITIRLRDPETGIRGIIIIAFDLGDDLANVDNTAPSVPTALAAIPASTSGIVVVWNSSQDDNGVAGYNVYRDGVKVATAPYPVFSDTGLAATMKYCYTIEAFDGAGNTTAQTASVCGTTLGVADTLSPPVPQNLTALVAGASSIVLAWLPSSTDDVLGYDIYRGTAGAVDQKIATSVASAFTDAGLTSGTQYCYTVRAFDAALNRSEPSAEACASTQSGGTPSDTAAPTSLASLAAGTYTAAQTVTLSCDDGAGSGCAAIYYTVDGSEPSAFSPVYNQPLGVSANTTLRFFAVDQVGNVEAPQHTAVYVIDLPVNLPAPAPTLALGYGTKQLKFTWGAISGATYYQFFEDPDGVSGYTQIGGDLTATAYNHDIALYRRVNARYQLKACNNVGCTNSPEVVMSANVTSAIGYIKATNTGADDYFGYAVALSGDGNTLAVSAAADLVGTVASNPGEDGGATGVGGDQISNSAANSGAVYVYVRNGNTWETQAYIKATNTDTADNFGRSLDLSYDGNTLAVGATQEDGNGSSPSDNSLSLSGAAYVYVRNNGDWAPQAYLKASNAGNQDYFGYSLALSADGNTLVVAAALEPNYTTGVGGTGTTFSENSGAVYVFARNGIAWSEQAYIKATNAIVVSSVAKYFGWSLALSADGNTLAVGAVGDDSGATGVNAPDSNPTCTVIACVADSGAVYVYSRSGTTWSGQAYIKATNTGGGDQFGYAVALSGDGNTLAVGAPLEDSNATMIGGDQNNNGASAAGAVYVYLRDNGTWSPQTYVKAINSGANLQFGRAVALNGDGNLLAVGASPESGLATGVSSTAPSKHTANQSGAVYAYARGNGAWAHLAYIKASNAQALDSFGDAVDLSADGNTLAVGAIGEDSNAVGVGGSPSDNSAVNSGAAYLY